MATEKEGKELMSFLKKCTGYQYNRMINKGFDVDYDELLGELALTYVKAHKSYNKNKVTAKLETYLARAFDYTALRIKRDIIKRGIFERLLAGDKTAQRDNTGSGKAGNPKINKNLLITKILGKLKKNESIDYRVVEDYIRPSQQIIEALRMRDRKMSLVNAVALVHGVKPFYVKLQLKRSRAFLKGRLAEVSKIINEEWPSSGMQKAA